MSVHDAPTYCDAQLSWLINKRGIPQPRVDRRLNAIENMLGALVRRWHGDGPLIAERSP